MPSLTLPKDLSGYRPNDAGIVAHAIVAILSPHLHNLTAVALPERVLDVAGALVNGDNINRRRVLMLTAAGHASVYLRTLAPASPWELLGAEFDTGNGHVDVAWSNTETGEVFFDELKTTNRAISMINNVWLGQVRRYAEAGADKHGETFLGVRLLPLGSLHLSVLVGADGSRTPITPSPSTPLQPREDGA